jgi:cephalosporin hydroxylase
MSADFHDMPTSPEQAKQVQQFTQNVISWFNQAYYFNRQQTWLNTFWLGVPVRKCPTDLWIYQELLFQTRPTVIIETGTCGGGSALFLAHLGDLLGGIRILTVDLTSANPPHPLPAHPSITYLSGSSTDLSIVAAVRAQLRPNDRVMVILDSDHAAAHVRAEIDHYAPLVTPGCYLIVEDSNVNGHPVYPRHGPGPLEALLDWLPAHPEFQVDRQREKFMLTFNPSGYLRRR